MFSTPNTPKNLLKVLLFAFLAFRYPFIIPVIYPKPMKRLKVMVYKTFFITRLILDLQFSLLRGAKKRPFIDSL
jgi:hypothetical protein